MSAGIKPRSKVSILRQISKYKSVEAYLKSLSGATIKNYKKVLIDCFEELENKSENIKLLNKYMRMNKNSGVNIAMQDCLEYCIRELDEIGFMGKDSFDFLTIIFSKILFEEDGKTLKNLTLKSNKLKPQGQLILEESKGIELIAYGKLFDYVYKNLPTCLNEVNHFNYYNIQKIQKNFCSNREEINFKGGLVKLRENFEKKYTQELV